MEKPAPDFTEHGSLRLPKYEQRFTVGTQGGRHGNPWAVTWYSHTSDVYLTGRIFGGNFKVSVHESGECHVDLPEDVRIFSDFKYWKIWSIDPAAPSVQAFGIVTPTSELRDRDWRAASNKPTHWVTPGPESTEIAIFLLRMKPEPIRQLAEKGWRELIVYRPLPDGRDLCVTAGPAPLDTEQIAGLDAFKTDVRGLLIETHSLPRRHPRAYGLTKDDSGVHRWLDVAVNDED